MIEHFRKILDEHLPDLEEKKFLLAVSGGLDSVVLCHLFARARLNFAIAHCNFKLRNEESDEDERWVKHLAQQLEVPYYSESFATAELAEKEKISIQMMARDLRYQWFHELCRLRKADYIVTAHHRDDQVETFFINLLRGSGLDGLTGMKIAEGRLFRPLLPFSREEITAYARQHEVTWREDSSNASTLYLRNRLRHELLPLFEQINPSFYATVAETMEKMADIQQFYHLQMTPLKNRLLQRNAFGYEISLEEVKAQAVPRLVLFELLRQFGFNRSHIDTILSAPAADSGKKFFSAGYRAVNHRGQLLITRISPEDLTLHEIAEGQTQLDEPIRLRLDIQSPEEAISRDSRIACFDAGQLTFPLVLRKWHKGDSFFPFGMKGRKKLSDFFIDQKLSLVEKEHCYVLCSGDQLIWVVGYRIDNRYRVNPETRSVLRIEWLH